MKVSIGMLLRDAPWGGGNRWGQALVRSLQERGVEVRFDLKDPDLDVIVVADPREGSSTATYTDIDIIRYLAFRNWKAVVVHRVNECDERKGTTHVNARLRDAAARVDHVAFISGWLRDLHLGQGMRTAETSVQRNGGEPAIFDRRGYHRWDGVEPLRLVTHHWGNSWQKGFDVYQELDRMLGTPEFSGKVEFTYIGRLPDGFAFANSRYVEPLNGPDLAAAIQQHHVYLTASQNEPAGMHHIEGALCGLPLLYRESGALPEYCRDFGISFAADTFEQALGEMLATYDQWADRMGDYPWTDERMCEGYYRLFADLCERRPTVLARRAWWKRPVWAVRGLLALVPTPLALARRGVRLLRRVVRGGA